jgi:hypothetical protein
VPVNDFWNFGVVEYVHGDTLAFTKAQDGTGSRAVVRSGFDYSAWRNLYLDGRDAERYVGVSVFLRRLQCDTSRELGACRSRQQSEKFSALYFLH